MSNTTYHFIFGQEASDIYLNNDFNELLEDIENIQFAICKITPNDSPIDIISAYDGWGGYAIITEEEYNILHEHAYLNPNDKSTCRR
jgi:hypothetical protein